ncbi:Gyltl1B protein-like protein, partial [Dinothrombium tinctorium]
LKKWKANEIIDFCGHSSLPSFTTENDKYRLEYIPLSGISAEASKKSLTLVTQVSMDRMGILEKTLQTWTGPVSLAVYVPVKNLASGLLEWQKLYLNKKLKSLKLSSGSTVVVVIGIEGDNEYPINKMRNAAMKQVKTKYSLLLDADFQPSPDLSKRFLSVVSKINSTNRTAFVIPAFEYLETPKKDDGIPKVKEELMQLVMREDPLVQPFRIQESIDSHKSTNYWKWYVTSRPYNVLEYADKYEPYLILENKQQLPLFDEQFTGYGMNKVTHTTELFAAGYKFIVLPDVWTIHLPHKSSSYSQDFLQNPQLKLKNRHQRFQFLHRLVQKYKIKQEKCNES